MSAESEGLKVLLVGAEPVLADVYRLRPDTDGYRARVAGPGALGVTAATDYSPDLVVADARATSNDLGGLLRELRDRRDLQGVPVILLRDQDGVSVAGDIGRLGLAVSIETSLDDYANRVRGWVESEQVEVVPRDSVQAPEESSTATRQTPSLPARAEQMYADIVHKLFAIGLGIQSVAGRVDQEPLIRALLGFVEDIDQLVGELRDFTLQSEPGRLK